MKNYASFPLYQAADLLISPSTAFSLCGICRIDSGAEQHRQRLASRNLPERKNYPLSALPDPKPRTDVPIFGRH